MKNIISRSISALTTSEKTRRQRKSRPVSEALEDRVLLSNVTVSFENGDLRLEGDSGDNAITVEQQGDRIIVQGYNGTELNGRNQSLLFTTNGVPDDVIMDFRDGGENTIGMDGINVGDDVQFRGGRSHDRFGFINGSVGDDMKVRTGNGRDSFLFSNGTVDDHLDVNTGSGNDKVVIGGDNSVVRDLTIKTGRGRDGLIFGGMRVQDDLAVNMGSGNDIAFIGELEVDSSGSLKVNLSGGNDDLVMDDSDIDAQTTLSGGSGSDGWEITDTTFSELPALNSFESNSVPNLEGRSLELIQCIFEEFEVLGS
jgi:hypothetical protein